MEGRGLDPLRDRPVHGPIKDIGAVAIHAKDKRAIGHHTTVPQAADRGVVVAS